MNKKRIVFASYDLIPHCVTCEVRRVKSNGDVEIGGGSFYRKKHVLAVMSAKKAEPFIERLAQLQQSHQDTNKMFSNASDALCKEIQKTSRQKTSK